MIFHQKTDLDPKISEQSGQIICFNSTGQVDYHYHRSENRKNYEKIKKIIYKSVYTPIGISPSGRDNEWKGYSCRIYWWSSSTLRRKVKPSIFLVIGSSRCHRIKLKYSDGVSRSTLTCFIFVLWSASVPAPPRTARAQSALEKQPSSRDPPERWWW